MTTEIWIIMGAIIAMVVFTQMGWRKLSAFGQIRPLVIVVALCFIYLRDIPTSGPNMLALAVSALMGCLFGLGLTGLTRVRRDATHGAQVWCGFGYLALWLAVMALRILLIYSMEYWYKIPFYHFMMSNHLSYNMIAPAFILMVVAMILVRMFGITAKLRGVRSQAVALAD